MQMLYEHQLPTHHIWLFKKATYVYDVYYPKQLTNGVTNFICRELAKTQIDFSKDPPVWGEEETIDISSITRFSNPIAPYKNILGYDFHRDRLLIVLGEWDRSSWLLNGREAKLVSVDRNLSTAEIMCDDIFAKVQEAVPNATHIRGYAHFSGYDGKIVGAVATYRENEEKSVIVVFDGSRWFGVRCNMRLDTVQEGVVPIWSRQDVFVGWLTEGHSTNSLFIKHVDLTIKPCYPPIAITTTEPVYDMINRLVVWTEWGASEPYAQRIHVSTPDPEKGCVDFKNVTPYGRIKDGLGYTIDLATTNKYRPAIYKDNVHSWLVVGAVRGGIPVGSSRILRAELGRCDDPTKWGVISDPSGKENLTVGMGLCLSQDKKPLPLPLIPVAGS